MIKIKKIANFRVLFYLFVLGLFCVFISYKMFLDINYCFLLIVPVAFSLILFYKKRYIFFVFSILFFCFLCVYPFVFLDNYTDYSFNRFNNLYITGKITNINRLQNDFCFITIENVNVVDEEGNTYNLNGRTSLSVYINDDIYVDLYDRIAFSSKIEGMEILDENNEIETFYLRNNIRYSASINSSEIIFLKSEATLLEDFREYNRDLLIKGFGEKLGNLAFTSLYGDTNYTDRDLLNEFSYSGVAHIFSVSGIHISLIAFLINYILNKLKVDKRISFVILGVILFFFCMLCNFNSPVIRSSIMSMVALLASIWFRKYDGLNSTSLSGCILLLINPMYVFDVGFQMTFLSILGIIMFSNLFKRVRINNKILSSVVFSLITSLSAQLALLPIFANVYGYISTWSLLANLIIIPLFSIFYTMLFMLNILVLICPFLKFVYFFPKCMLETIIYINQFVNMLPYSIIYTQIISTPLTFLYYINMFVLSKYVVLEWKYKIIISLLLLSVITLGIIIEVDKTASLNVSLVNEYKIERIVNTNLTSNENLLSNTIPSKKINSQETTNSKGELKLIYDFNSTRICDKINESNNGLKKAELIFCHSFF